jgi:hypothetical protein
MLPVGAALAAPGACYAYPPCQIYTSEVFGGIHPDGGSPAITNEPTFGSPLARAAHPFPSTPGVGLVLDAYGGLHPYGTPAVSPSQFPYYPGNDIARDFVINPNGNGGYELDGFGGIHPFSTNGALPAAPTQYPYFPGNDVAKKITMLANGSGGYVLDAFGGVHPWAVTGFALPVPISQSAYWPTNIARDIWVDPTSTGASTSGFVIDAFGGFHGFWSANSAAPLPIVNYPYWTGRDIARALWFLPGSVPAASAGYVLDAYGGIHPFAGQGQSMPANIFPFGYWNGQDLARNLWGQ